MISTLSIQNFLLVDNLNIEFENGLCVLTGETGAGKSILLDALDFLMGGRISAKFIRSGNQSLTVSAVFDISQNDILKNIFLILKSYFLSFNSFLIS